MEETANNQQKAVSNNKVDSLFDQLESLAVEKLNRLEESNSELEGRLAKLEAALNTHSAHSTQQLNHQQPSPEQQPSLTVETSSQEASQPEAALEIKTLKPREQLNKWTQAYPKAFIFSAPKPLKIGIHQDLQQAEELTEKQVKRALANYVKLPRYFSCLKAGAERVDLQGEVCGLVTEEEADFAKQQLEKLAAHKKSKQPAKLQELKANETKKAREPKLAFKPNKKRLNKAKQAVNKQPANKQHKLAKTDKAFSNTALQDQLQKLLSK